MEEAGEPYKGLSSLYAHKSYTEERTNICAICGKVKDFSKLHLIPNLYRVQLPQAIKAHTSADNLILCQPCHERSIRIQDSLKVDLAESFGLSLLEKSKDHIAVCKLLQV